MRQRIIDKLPEGLDGRWFVPDPMLIWVLAILLSLALSLKYARQRNLDLRAMYWAGVWSIVGGLWGGHIMEVLVTPRVLLQEPLVFFRFMDGGKAIIGGIIGGTLLGWIYLRWKKASILTYADTVVPAIALGYTIGRFGCFLNGCCFGTRSDLPWAVKFPKHTLAFFEHWSSGWLGNNDVLSLAVHPTQLYHAVFGLFLFLLLRKWQGRWPGSCIAVGFAAYGILRFSLQFFRGDRTPVLGFLDINQIFSLIFVLIAGLLWWRFGRKQTVSSRAIPSLPSAETLQPERL